MSQHILLRGSLLAALLAAPTLAHAEDEPTAAAGESVEGGPDTVEAREDGFGWAALPALNYNSDEGFGYGVIGTGYWYRDDLDPYKYALTLRIFLTTKWVHAHMVRIDALDVGGLPLRIDARAGYDSYLTQSFCGWVGDVDCSTAEAEAAAEGSGLAPPAAGEEGTEEWQDFVRRYHLMRYTAPYAQGTFRWRLTELPHKVEAMGGYRGTYYVPGTPQDFSPWPGSLYQAEYFPDGETGFASVLQAGIMVDNRDSEPAPNSGYWVEGSLRGSSKYIGSAWDYFGFNVTLRGYLSLWPDHLVSATRLVVDGVVGDGLGPNELARFGGSQVYSGLGGQYGGRGLRSYRYLGKAKSLLQQELRWTVVTLEPGDQTIGLGLNGNFDLATPPRSGATSAAAATPTRWATAWAAACAWSGTATSSCASTPPSVPSRTGA